MKPKVDSQQSYLVRKHATRLAVVQALYQREITHCDAEHLINEFLQYRIGKHTNGDNFTACAEKKLFTNLIRCFYDRMPEIILLIKGALRENLQLERLETTLRAILYASTSELLFHKALPIAIVINEYIDITKAFFDDHEPQAIINGVLNTIAHQLACAPETTTKSP